MNYQNIKKAFAYTLFGLLVAACNREGGDAHGDENDPEGYEKNEGHEEREGHEKEEDEDNDESEESDLDRPVSELFADTCEHGIKTHECDECRYEVGVRMPRSAAALRDRKQEER